MHLPLSLETLNKRLASLEQENAELKIQVALLIQENDRLKERLGLNSTNSSLPPSRDIYKARRQERPRSPRNPGGQPGHKPPIRQPFVADETVDVLPSLCRCGHKLEVQDSFQVHQKVEIPPLKPYVTQYHLHHGFCTRCRKRRVAPLPAGVGADLLGDQAKTVVAALSGFFHQSRRQAQLLLATVFNLHLSLGLISKTEHRVSSRLDDWYQNLTGSLEDSPYLHIDETGHKSQGKRGWAWIVTTRNESLLKLASSRGKKVLQALLPAYEGQVISDRYGAYNHFDPDQRQVCWSHLKRDFERFAHSRNEGLAGLGKALGLLTDQVFSIYKSYKNHTLEKDVYQHQTGQVKQDMKHTLNSILLVPDVPQAHRVAHNMLKSFEMMWRFVDNDRVEPTNNLAERQIRKYVIYRKTSLFTGSKRGNEYIERMISLFLTARLQKQNAYLQLSNLIASPSLPP